MLSVRAVVPRDPEQCWRAFIDAETLAAWVPGLRRTRVIQTHEDGLPKEILFEYGPSLTYSLVYTYDLANREVRWEPRAGKRDAVAGYARFEATEEGTCVVYCLAQGEGRTATDKALGDQTVLLAAFEQWIKSRR